MNSFRNTARHSGILFLTAMAASLVGGGLLDTLEGKSNVTVLASGISLEIINALAVLGIGILLFPVLKTVHFNASKIYLGLRILEFLACFAAPLTLVVGTNGSYIRVIFTGSLIPLFFCCGALVFYSVLYQYQLLPRFISIWGFIGVAGIVALNLFNVKTSAGIILALPIILNEIFLGIWLIMKGFQTSENVKSSQ